MNIYEPIEKLDMIMWELEWGQKCSGCGFKHCICPPQPTPPAPR